MGHRYRFVLLAIAALVPSLAEAANFTLNIPDRGADPPFAVAKVTLEAVAGVATLTIDGTSITIPADGALAPTPLATGDIVVVARTGSTYTITIRMLSRFPSSTQLCALKPAAPGSLAYSMVFNVAGAGTPINAYRTTLYATGYTGGATSANVNCSCANVRVKVAPDVLWPPATKPPGTDRGRHALDFIFVLDNSGSMFGTTPPDSISKWAALDSAMSQTVDFWIAHVLPGETAFNEDRLGLIFFSTSVEEFTVGPNFFIRRGDPPAAGGSHPWDMISNFVSAHGPTNMTNLGGGLAAAVCRRVADAQKNNDITIVLMTDGMQNQSPMVTEDAAGVRNLSFSCLTPNVQAVRAQCVPVMTIGLGDPAASTLDVNLLDDLAEQTSGRSAIVRASTTSVGFLDAIKNGLQGDTTTLLKRDSGTYPDAGNFPPLPVFVDSTAKSLIAVVSGKSTSRASLQVEFISPKGFSVKPSLTRGGGGRDYQVVRVEVDPQAQGVGEWKVKLRKCCGEFPPRGDVPFTISSYAIERAFDFSVGFAEVRHRTGEKIVLDVQASLDGKVLTDIADSLRLTVHRPKTAIGNLLVAFKSDPRTGVTIQGDAVSAYNDKLDALAKARGGNLGDPLAEIANQKLIDKGNGHYVFEVSDTNLPGTYKFDVVLDATRGTERIVRRQSIETQVEVLPDPTKSVVTLRRGEVQGMYSLLVTPRDKFGNYVGPGYDHRIAVKVDLGGRVDGAPADPNLDGGYSVSLSGITPISIITVAVGDQQIVRGTVAQIQAGPVCTTGCCKVFGCGGAAKGGSTLLPSALAILWLVWRRRREARKQR